MAKKNKKGASDLGSRLKNIPMLVETKRIKEAIAYQFMIFVVLCTAKYKRPKLPSQSIRDYAMIMVKEFNMDPGSVYPFIQEIEQVIYGGKAASLDAYQRSLVTFGQVFEQIVGKPLPLLAQPPTTS